MHVQYMYVIIYTYTDMPDDACPNVIGQQLPPQSRDAMGGRVDWLLGIVRIVQLKGRGPLIPTQPPILTILSIINAYQGFGRLWEAPKVLGLVSSNLNYCTLSRERPSVHTSMDIDTILYLMQHCLSRK